MSNSPEDTVWWTCFTTPLGDTYIAATRQGVCKIALPEETREHFIVWLHRHFKPAHILPHPGPCMEAIEQLEAYFGGHKTRFELSLDLRGTPFQKKVWQTLLQIPYGQTISYRQLAEEVNKPAGYQAVGAAVSQNPVLVIVPCHRVISASGHLAGYAAGIQTKRWLLQHEGILLL